MSATPLYSAKLITAASGGVSLVRERLTRFSLKEILLLYKLGVTTNLTYAVLSTTQGQTGTLYTYTEWKRYFAYGLPSSLFCDESGMIAGRPMVSGTYMVIVEVRSSTFTYEGTPAGGVHTDNGSAVLIVPVIVEDLPVVGTDPPALDMIVFSDQELATNVEVSLRPQDQGSYTEIWQVSGLPPGLTFNSSNYIVGRPTLTGVYAVTITLSYNLSYGGEFFKEVRVFTFTVTHGAPVISSRGFQSVWTENGMVYPLTLEPGAVTTVQLAATGLPTAWTAPGLPPGLTIDNAGLITGNPEAEGIYDVAIVATNGAGDSVPFVARFTIAMPVVSSVLRESGIDVFFDVQSRELLLDVPKSEQVLAEGSIIRNESGVKKLAIKNGETLQLNLRFIKGGKIIDPDAAGIRFGVASRAGGPLLLDSADFTKVGTGSLTRYVMYVDVSSDEFTSLFDTYFDDEAVEDGGVIGNAALEVNAVCEVELSTGSGPSLVKLRSNSLDAVIMRSIF